MKYRIKIITYKNGRKGYYAQFRNLFWWTGLLLDGEPGYAQEFSCRKDAINAIDLHFDGNTQKQTIEFEYITK